MSNNFFGVRIDLNGITTVEPQTKRNIKRNKGQSIIDFPDNYTLLDLETTGLQPQYDDVLEIGALKVKDNHVVDEFSMLLYPDDPDQFSVPTYITNLTGITMNDLLTDGVHKDIALHKLQDFIADDTLLGYNTNFDINFIYDLQKRLFDTDFQSNYIDIMRFARKALPELKHHRLKDMIKYFEINDEQIHRSLSDCYQTNLIFDRLKNLIEETMSLTDFKNSFHRSRVKNGKNYSVRAKDIKTDVIEFDETNPFYSMNVCFTGKMDSLVRRSAEQIIKDLGGTPQDRVTKQTDYLILGDTNYAKNVKNGVTGKMAKAQKYNGEGLDISIITESIFLEMLTDE